MKYKCSRAIKERQVLVTDINDAALRREYATLCHSNK